MAEPNEQQTGAGDAELSVSVKAGADVTRVTVTFDIARSSTEAADIPAVVSVDGPLARAALKSNAQLAAGRKLPKLLFATYRPRLENNIGVSEAKAALQLIRDAGQTVYEVQKQASAWSEVQAQIKKEAFEGVVILGGYDVLPGQRLDVLPPSLRNRIGAVSDLDNFIVWNDEAYGDKTGDTDADVPISRIPDAKSPRLVMAALTADAPPANKERFGMRNSARPFAAEAFGLLPGQASLLVSAPAKSPVVGNAKAGGDIVYIMLHGSDVDASRFWGEENGGTVEAINLTNVPRTLSGVTFAGCCWGALIVDRRASISSPGEPLGIRTSSQSMALSYLHSGARAFVGCTGTHYSPTVAPYNYFGGPMHTAFFKHLLAGEGPSLALFHAKIEYAKGMPHGQNSTVGKAIEFKIWKEFTCLGLGW